MRNRISSLLQVAAVFVALDLAHAATGESQELQTYLQQQNYQFVQTSDDLRFNAKINGQTVTFSVSGGYNFTSISRGVAGRLGLKVRDLGATNLGLEGRQFGLVGSAPVSSFIINGYEINRATEIQILPRSEYLRGTEGVLGYDDLHRNWAIYAIGGAGFFFRPGTLNPPAALGVLMRKAGYGAVPLRISHEHLMVDGSLNGSPFIAQINFKSDTSFFRTEYLKGLKIPVDDTNYRKAFGKRWVRWRCFQPSQLSLGSVKLPATRMGAGYADFLKGEEAEAEIGKDLLEDHDAIFEAGSNILWLK